MNTKTAVRRAVTEAVAVAILDDIDALCGEDT